MQEAVKKSQGGILKGRTVDHLMRNYNRAKISSHAMLFFFGRWTGEEREDIKLSSLSID